MKYEFREVDDKGKPCHLHTLDGKPLTGTSSIGDVLAKPLSWWASGLACEKLGWINAKKKINGKYVETPLEKRLEVVNEVFTKVKTMTPEQYLDLLDEAYKAHSVRLKDTAETGTDLHAELEDYVKAKMGMRKFREYDPKIKPFIDWAEQNVAQFLWSEAHCFDQDLWVGGISDAGALLKDGNVTVIDFKSAKEAYTTHFIQAAGYSILINKNGLWSKDGSANKKLEQPINAIIIVAFGAEKVEPAIRFNVEDYAEGFRCATSLYRLLGLEKH